MATYWGHLYKPQGRKTQGTQNTSLNTITYLLIILGKSLTKASEELWPASHQCSPVVILFFILLGLPSKRLIVGRLC